MQFLVIFACVICKMENLRLKSNIVILLQMIWRREQAIKSRFGYLEC